MDQVRVILDECYDTIQILCIIGTQAIETSGLFLQNLIPSNVQVNQRSVLPNDLKELGEDDGPQTLPTYVNFFQSKIFLDILAKLGKRIFTVMHINQCEVLNAALVLHQLEKLLDLGRVNLAVDDVQSG